jgi:hypothetical protein
MRAIVEILFLVEILLAYREVQRRNKARAKLHYLRAVKIRELNNVCTK